MVINIFSTLLQALNTHTQNEGCKSTRKYWMTLAHSMLYLKSLYFFRIVATTKLINNFFLVKREKNSYQEHALVLNQFRLLETPFNQLV